MPCSLSKRSHIADCLKNSLFLFSIDFNKTKIKRFKENIKNNKKRTPKECKGKIRRRCVCGKLFTSNCKINHKNIT